MANFIFIFIFFWLGVFIGNADQKTDESITPKMVIQVTKECLPSTFKTMAPSGHFTCKNHLSGQIEMKEDDGKQ